MKPLSINLPAWSRALGTLGFALVTAGLTYPTPAAAQTVLAPNPAFEAWTRDLATHPEVTDELGRFEHRGKSLSPSYRTELSVYLRAQVIAAATAGLATLLSADCEPFIQVEFLRSGFMSSTGSRSNGEMTGRGDTEKRDDPPKPNDTEKRFEDSFVRTEMIACLPVGTVDPTKALEIYVSPDFRREANSRIADVDVQGDIMCVETNGAWRIISPASACNRTQLYSAEGIAAEHSQVIENGDRDGLQAVYFKESLKTFVTIPGGLALHYINYARAMNLGRISRSIAGGKIEDAQRKNVEALVGRLGGPAN